MVDELQFDPLTISIKNKEVVFKNNSSAEVNITYDYSDGAWVTPMKIPANGEGYWPVDDCVDIQKVKMGNQELHFDIIDGNKLELLALEGPNSAKVRNNRKNEGPATAR